MTALEDLLSAIPDCRSCRLGGLHSVGIPGRGNPHSPIMFVAEAPGVEEVKHNKILVGATGRELDKLLSRVGIAMSNVWLANTVNCWPGPGNPSPKPDEVDACRYWLDGQIAIIEPRVVVAMGTAAISHFLSGDGRPVADLHGRPIDMGAYTLYPTYHPAAALHNPKMLTRLHEDFARIPGLLSGGVVTGTPEVVDEYPNPEYRLLEFPGEHPVFTDELDWDWWQPHTIAVDTETDRDGRLWCISFSVSPGTAYVVMRDKVEAVRQLFCPPHTLVFHNSVFDLGVLAAAGIQVTAKVEDTMLMAHVLEEERLGLKFLARTLLGMEMDDYDDIVRPAQYALSIDYLTQIVQHGEWPPAPPTEEMLWEKKTNSLKIRTRKPQPIGKKAARIIADATDKGADPWERWKGVDAGEKAVVEGVLGLMPTASIEDVKDQGRWVRYSARDADATLRLLYVLRQRLSNEEVQE